MMHLFEFRSELIEWGSLHRREFPWRTTDNALHVLLAEVLLHRTQAKQVLPVYSRIIQDYGRFEDMRALSIESWSELCRSLGLQWRISLIPEMLDAIEKRFSGVVPRSREDLLSLPGVSDYIASSVRCFVWNEPDPIVDTNVVRVVGRIIGVPTKDSTRRNQTFNAKVASLLDPTDPKAFNLAVLDLADSVCVARGLPKCESCPVARFCKSSSSLAGEHLGL
jgi:A/G-specific adenine glycosylase